jgi:hypothetical protein
MTKQLAFVDVATPDRGSWIVVESAGELHGLMCRVLSIKPGARGPWLELRLEDGRTWSMAAEGLLWHYAGTGEP